MTSVDNLLTTATNHTLLGNEALTIGRLIFLSVCLTLRIGPDAS